MRALPNVAQRSWVSGCNRHNKFVLSAVAKVEDPQVGGDEIPPRRGKKCDNCASRSLGEGWTTYPYCLVSGALFF